MVEQSLFQSYEESYCSASTQISNDLASLQSLPLGETWARPILCWGVVLLVRTQLCPLF
jgi:hypothetical protein